MAFLPITFTVDFDDGCVMDDPVDGGNGHHGVREDLIPLAKRLVK